MTAQAATHARSQPLDIARIFVGECRLKNGADEMRRGDLVFSTPPWSARDLSETAYALVGMNPDQQEGRYGMGAAAGANGQFRPNRHAHRNTVNMCDLHRLRSPS